MIVAGLLDRNPAAHGVWIVAEATFALLVVFLLIELYDRWMERLRARAERGAGTPIESPPPRRRRATPFGVLRRFWTEGRLNERASNRDAERRVR
jgi:hypothetical protein